VTVTLRISEGHDMGVQPPVALGAALADPKEKAGDDGMSTALPRRFAGMIAGLSTLTVVQ
jgi:hypothetical protein